MNAQDMQNVCQRLLRAADSNIDGLGDVKSELLKNWALDPVNRSICLALYNSGVRPAAAVVAAAGGQPLVGVAFCITGVFDEDRDKLATKLESLGAVQKSGVSKSLTHLIVGENAGGTKLVKYNELVAKGFKIEKVGKDWLTKTLDAAGIGMTNTSTAVEED